MGKIYTIGNKEHKVFTELGYQFIQLPGFNNSNEVELHEFVLRLFQQYSDIEKLIIDITADAEIAFKTAFHIRLSINELKEKCLIPIIFASTNSIKQQIKSSGNWGHILCTSGVTIENHRLISTIIENEKSLNPVDYKSKFLDLIQILPDDTIGKHSIANEWGAFIMDKNAQLNILQNSTFTKLYFKYINAFQIYSSLLPNQLNVLGNISVNPKTIAANGKKILLIDDEADKGWEQVLRKIFKTTNDDDFCVINEQVKNYDAFSEKSKSLIEKGNFDLFLLDLRLNGVQEDESKNVTKFSGADVLSKLKSLNKGSQVLMFTASNKIWNIEPLKELGADSYYIKESPEYKLSKSISEANFNTFRKNVNLLLDRGYLKTLWIDINVLITSVNKFDSKFKDELVFLFNQAYEMHYVAKTEKQFAYAYFTLYQIIERINFEYVQQEDSIWKVNGELLIFWKFDSNSKSYIHDLDTQKIAEWKKTFAIWYQYLDKDNFEPLNLLYELIKMRNDFIHNEASINTKIYNKNGFMELFGIVKILVRELVSINYSTK